MKELSDQSSSIITYKSKESKLPDPSISTLNPSTFTINDNFSTRKEGSLGGLSKTYSISNSSNLSFASSKTTHGDELESPPSTGSLLLEWTKKRMSFISTSEDDETIDDGSTSESRSKKSSSNIISPKKRSREIKKTKIKEAQKEIQIGPPPGEDEILWQYKLRKEQQDLSYTASKKKVVLSNILMNNKTKPKKKKQDKLINKRKMYALNKAKIAAEKLEKERKLKELKEARIRNEILELKYLKETEFTLRLIRKALNRIVSSQAVGHNIILEKRKEQEWKDYISCRKFPRIDRVNQITEYITKFEENINDMTIEKISVTIGEILMILDELYAMIQDNLPQDKDKLKNWIWVEDLLKNKLQEYIHKCNYKILACIDKKTERKSIEYSEFNFKDDNFKLYIRVFCDLPIPKPNPRKPPKPPIKITFPDLEMDIMIPTTLNTHKTALRCLHLSYDHLTDKCHSFALKNIPKCYTTDLEKTLSNEIKMKQKYKYECYLRSEHERKQEERFKSLEAKIPFYMRDKTPLKPIIKPFILPKLSSSDKIPEVPFQILNPSPDEYVIFAEDFEYEKARNLMTMHVELNEVNLRQYQIIGGLYHINLFEHPPQPQSFVLFHCSANIISPPRVLEDVPFCYDFTSAPQFKGGESVGNFDESTPSQLLNKTIQKQDPEDRLELWFKVMEEENKNMIQITMRLPDNVVFFETPFVCLWNEKLKIWETTNVHRISMNEEKISFCLSKFGCLSFASWKFIHLPYFSWEIKPVKGNIINFTIKTRQLDIIFEIKGLSVKVKFPSLKKHWMVLKKLENREYSIALLVKTLRSKGIDIFPEHDAFCYISRGVCEKHWPLTFLTYCMMSFISPQHHFRQSKWNADAGRRNLIFEVREYCPESRMGGAFRTLQITPHKCEPVDVQNNELKFVDRNFKERLIPNLWYYMKTMSKATTREKIALFPRETISTLSQLLIKTRVLSFS